MIKVGFTNFVIGGIIILVINIIVTFEINPPKNIKLF